MYVRPLSEVTLHSLPPRTYRSIGIASLNLVLGPHFMNVLCQQILYGPMHRCYAVRKVNLFGVDGGRHEGFKLRHDWWAGEDDVIVVPQAAEGEKSDSSAQFSGFMQSSVLRWRGVSEAPQATPKGYHHTAETKEYQRKRNFRTTPPLSLS